jgi:tetratricopeptide (TPR) repeat protein
LRKPIAFAALAAAAALAVAAVPPPNLDRTLSTQQALVAREPTAERHNDLGNLLLLAGREDEAIEAYEEALALDPTLASAHYNLGLALQQRGEERSALRHFRAVVDGDPEHARAWFQIGFLHEAAGAEGAAVRAYARAYLLDPRLSFADENPQVLDSELVTRALLRAQEELSAAVEAPRAYEEPRRIAGLLLPSTPAAEPAVAAAEPAPETQPPPGQHGLPIIPLIPGIDPPAAQGDAAGGRRVLTPGDLQPGSRVGEVTTAPGVTGSVTHLPDEQEDYSELLRQRLLQQQEMQQLESGEVAGGAPPAYYLPGPNSTGRVEQELEERLAAVTPTGTPRG